jgi:hypothetical protein
MVISFGFNAPLSDREKTFRRRDAGSQCKFGDGQRDVDQKIQWPHPGTVDAFFACNGCKPLAPCLADSHVDVLYW